MSSKLEQQGANKASQEGALTSAEQPAYPDDARPATGNPEPRGDGVHVQSVIETRGFRGPLPPPELLREYQEIQGDLVERIVCLSERESAHRHEIEQALVNSNREVTTRGQYFGLIIATLALGVTLGALFLGMERAAMVLGGTTVVGLATVFVVGRWRETRSSDDE